MQAMHSSKGKTLAAHAEAAALLHCGLTSGSPLQQQGVTKIQE